MTRMPNLAATAAVLAVIAIVGGLTIGPRLGGAAIPSLEATPSAVASPTAVASRRPAQNGAIAVVVDTRLVLVDSTTGAILKVLVEGPTDPNAPIVVTDLAWAPDGQRLAYAATGGVWVMDVSDAISQQIVTCGIDAERLLDRLVAGRLSDRRRAGRQTRACGSRWGQQHGHPRGASFDRAAGLVA